MLEPEIAEMHVLNSKTRFKKNLLKAEDTEVVQARCPVCLQNNTRPYMTIADDEGTPVITRLACLVCGHVYHSRIPNSRWFEDFYRSDFEASGSAPVVIPAINYGHIYRAIKTTNQLSKLADLKVLDVGCGYGSALNYLEGMGCKNLFGIEPSIRRVAVARTGGFSIHHGFIETLPVSESITSEFHDFDFIYSHHAYEHTLDLQSAVLHLRNLLKIGGHVCISVPNFLSEHLIQQAHYVPHVHAFSENSLKKLFVINGFEIVSSNSALELIARKLSVVPSPDMLRDSVHTLKEEEIVASIQGKTMIDLPFLFTDTDKNVFIEYTDYTWKEDRVIISKLLSWKKSDTVPILNRLMKMLPRLPRLLQKLCAKILITLGARPYAPFIHCHLLKGTIDLQQNGLTEIKFVYDRNSANIWTK